MPKIAEQVSANESRIAAGGQTGTGVGPQHTAVSAPNMAPLQDLPAGGGLPQRGMFPADLTLNSDRSDSNRAFRGQGVRSSTFPFSPNSGSISTTIVESAAASASSSGSATFSNLTAGPGISIVASGKGFTVSGTTGSLSMPAIFSVSGAFPITAFPNGGPISVSLVDQNEGTFFAGPEVAGPGTSPILDQFATVSSLGSGGLTVGPLTPSTSGEFALVAFSPGFNLSTFTPSSWTQESPINLNTQGYIFHTVLGDTSPISPTLDYTGSTANAAALALFFAPNGVPQIVNTYKSSTSSTVAGLNTVTMNPTTAGNTLIFIGLADQSGPITFTSLGDSGGDNFVEIAYVVEPGGGNHVVNIWAASDITGGSTTLTFLRSGSGSAPSYCIYEVTNLLPSAGIPTFRAIVNTDLDGAIFGASGSTHNAGAVPDPGSVLGNYRVLFEDGTWKAVGLRPTIQTTTYGANPCDLVKCQTTGGGFTVTLPITTSFQTGMIVGVTKITSDANVVTIAANGSDLINGQASVQIAFQYTAITLVSDGAGNWTID